MPKLQAQSNHAHQQAVAFSIADIAQFLQETLGQKLVAYLADVDPKTVSRWANGERVPRLDSETRLRTTFQVFHLLQAEESPHTVRAWLVGINPQLDNEAPADAVREGRLRDVVVAALAYVAGG